ncbi:hypothetical protein [Croceicoccus bisphenolivorans]|uniref:hypothetical protein n=1 Tax=Croceicoccus bisphenolivorans TaxID=1783232 RepID=UPI0008336C1C|nr:hypothetical protein [Croceicoccus bisphenolivorans]
MKEIVLGGVAVFGVGLATFFAPPFKFGTFERLDTAHGPAYTLTTEQAVDRLLTAAPVKGQMPFGNLDLTISKVSADKVRFAAEGAHARFGCTATVFQARRDAVQVKTACTGGGSPSDGAAAPAVDEMKEIGFRELVDSTMQKRPFDNAKVQMQNTGAMMRNLPQMQKDALKMSAETGRMQQEYEADREDAEMRRWLESD